VEDDEDSTPKPLSDRIKDLEDMADPRTPDDWSAEETDDPHHADRVQLL
jgi:hypothetical protein